MFAEQCLCLIRQKETCSVKYFVKSTFKAKITTYNQSNLVSRFEREKRNIPLQDVRQKRRGIVTSKPLSFLKAFITCSLGIHRVGFVMICFGATDAFFSLTLGRLTKYTGRIPVFISGALIHLSVICMMLIWRPHHSLLWVFYVIAALLGYCDAVWQTQINGKKN